MNPDLYIRADLRLTELVETAKAARELYAFHKELYAQFPKSFPTAEYAESMTLLFAKWRVQSAAFIELTKVTLDGGYADD